MRQHIETDELRDEQLEEVAGGAVPYPYPNLGTGDYVDDAVIPDAFVKSDDNASSSGDESGVQKDIVSSRDMDKVFVMFAHPGDC